MNDKVIKLDSAKVMTLYGEKIENVSLSIKSGLKPPTRNKALSVKSGLKPPVINTALSIKVGTKPPAG